MRFLGIVVLLVSLAGLAQADQRFGYGITWHEALGKYPGGLISIEDRSIYQVAVVNDTVYVYLHAGWSPGDFPNTPSFNMWKLLGTDPERASRCYGEDILADTLVLGSPQVLFIKTFVRCTQPENDLERIAFDLINSALGRVRISYDHFAAEQAYMGLWQEANRRQLYLRRTNR